VQQNQFNWGRMSHVGSNREKWKSDCCQHGSRSAD
jgi:hypothetical protein